jgi:glycosyltransferase involved in cell wall biosynthesis
MVPTGDPAALRDALRQVLAMPAPERTAMGAAAARLAHEHYGVDALADRFVELVESTLR